MPKGGLFSSKWGKALKEKIVAKQAEKKEDATGKSKQRGGLFGRKRRQSKTSDRKRGGKSWVGKIAAYKSKGSKAARSRVVEKVAKRRAAKEERHEKKHTAKAERHAARHDRKKSRDSNA